MVGREGGGYGIGGGNQAQTQTYLACGKLRPAPDPLPIFFSLHFIVLTLTPNPPPKLKLGGFQEIVGKKKKKCAFIFAGGAWMPSCLAAWLLGCLAGSARVAVNCGKHEAKCLESIYSAMPHTVASLWHAQWVASSFA